MLNFTVLTNYTFHIGLNFSFLYDYYYFFYIKLQYLCRKSIYLKYMQIILAVSELSEGMKKT